MTPINRRVRQSVAGLFVVCATCLAGVTPVGAQENLSDPMELWDNLFALDAGVQVEIMRMDDTRVLGALLSVSNDRIVVSVKQEAVPILRSQIRQVRRAENPKKRSRVLTGLAIGAGAGFLVGLMTDCSRKTESCSGMNAVLFGLPIGAVVGAGIGGATARYPLVYRAPKSGVVTTTPSPAAAAVPLRTVEPLNP